VKHSFIAVVFYAFVNTVMSGEQEEPLAFYLVKDSLDASHLNELEPGTVKVTDKPLFTLDEIISVSRSDNTIELSERAFKNFARLAPGTPFAMCVDGKPRYLCRAWKQILSATSDSVVAIIQYPTSGRQIKIAAGYPTSAYFSGKDKGVDSAIVNLIQRELNRRKQK
jgi:hypothetical protein